MTNQIFTFENEEKTIIRHIPTGMLFEVLLNPTDGEDYDAWEDVYQNFEFRGNHITCLLLDSYKYEPEAMPVGWGRINSINRRAFKYYRQNVYIPAKEMTAGAFEDERYKLEEVCDGVWRVTDKKYLLTLRFEEGRFNETQEILELKDIEPKDFDKLASVLREMGDWMARNHRGIV